MKCEYCGGDIALEDVFCKHCGRTNTFGQQHREDMEKYRGEFEETKKLVKKKTALYSRTVVRVVVLSVLIVASLLMFFTGVNAYKIVRSYHRSEANRKYVEYSKVLDQYLEEGEYHKFKSFIESKDIAFYDSPYEDRYRNVKMMIDFYTNVYDYLVKFSNKAEQSARQAEYVNDALDYFYNRCIYSEDDSLYNDITDEEKALADRLVANIECMLQQFAGFTKEEAAAAPMMEKFERGMLLEQKRKEMAQNEAE